MSGMVIRQSEQGLHELRVGPMLVNFQSTCTSARRSNNSSAMRRHKRAVIPNPTDAERKRARLDRGEEEEETEDQGQAVASAVGEEDDGENDDSGSEVEYF